MAVLPWVNLPDNRVPDLLGGIGDTLVAAADRKRQEKQRAAEMLMKQREQDRQDQLAQAQIGNYASEAEARKANEARIAAGEKRQQGLDVAGAIPTIKSMLTPGSPNYDPESAMSLARAHGIDLQKVAAPLPPVEEGPRISPDDAQQAGLITSQQQTPSGSPLMQSMPILRTLDAVQGAGSDQRAVQQAEAERQRFADANTQKPASRLDTYSGNSPIGPVSIDPNASLEARRFAQERTRSELAPLVQAVPPQYRPTIQAMIQSGNYDAKAIQAAITEAQKEAKDEADKATYSDTQENRVRHEKAMEYAALLAARNRGGDPTEGGGAGPDLRAAIVRLKASGVSDADIIGNPAFAGVSPKLMKSLLVMEEGSARNDKGTASDVEKEMRENVKPLTEKGGLIEQQKHLRSTLNKLQANPNNPVEWTNAADAMIRTNTGRAAIKAQYDLYVSHGGGAFDKLESWVSQAASGNLGTGVQRNLMGAMQSTMGQMQREGADAERTFRETYMNDPRVQNNPQARASFEALHKGTFGRLEGGESIGQRPPQKSNPLVDAARKKTGASSSTDVDIDALAAKHGL